MNTTSRAILETLLATDISLSMDERNGVQRLIRGEPLVVESGREDAHEEQLLVTQQIAAKLLSVSRVTIWRMTREMRLHPVEILPGTWRYRYREIAAFAFGDKRGEKSADGFSHAENLEKHLGEKLGQRRIKLPQVA